MKKLLLVLLVVTLASFLFVGCLPVTPPIDDEDGVEPGICPTITITGQYVGVDKTYVKAGTIEIIVKYAQPTEGVSIYLVTTAVLPILLPYYVSDDGLTYTASATIAGDCGIFMIEAVDCYGECVCIESFVVDSKEPKAKMMLYVPECVCEECSINITSDYTIVGVCVDALGCCSDDCSGLKSWSIDVYDADPYDECCTIPCEVPVATCSESACPIDCVTACLPGSDSVPPVAKYYILMSMLDNVGNANKYWATVVFDSGCTVSSFEWWCTANKIPVGGTTAACIDWTKDAKAAIASGTLTTGETYFIFGETCD